MTIAKELFDYEITVKISAINRVKAKECLKYMLKGLDKHNIWYSRLTDIKKIKK